MPENASISKFRHHIQSAQDIYIKPAIGETCYNSLLDGVEGDDLTAIETILLDGDNRSFAGLKMALAWWVLWLAYPDLWLTISNATIHKKTGDNFESVTESEFNIKRADANRNAVHYTDYLMDYIDKNSGTYTCYSCTGISGLITEVGGIGIALDYDRIVKRSEEQEKLLRS